MNYEELLDLIDHIDQSSLAYVDYETNSHHVVISKEVPNIHLNQEPADAVTSVEQAVESAAATKEVAAEEVAEAPIEKSGQVVEAPMVGVVYLQPNPDEAQYVKIGDRIEQGEVICIVEAMKLMNEIQAPCSGIVSEILVQNEEVVEYGQPLMRIEEEI